MFAAYEWTGFYLGGHFGYGTGSFGPETNAEPLQGAFFPHSVTGMIGGYQVGYNWQLTNRVVLGVEADISFGSPSTSLGWCRPRSTRRSITSRPGAAGSATRWGRGCRT